MSVCRPASLAAILLALAFVAPACAGVPATSPDYLAGYPPLAADGLINVVVEIPAGTNDKWEVDKTGGGLQWEHEDGRPRVIQYLAYPANYGIVPRTSLPRAEGGDGDPVDVLLLGSGLPRGMVVSAKPIGVLRLTDTGERDDKILAVPTAGPLSDVDGLDDLDARYPGVTLIIETWFTRYKGPDRVSAGGFGDADEAMAAVLEGSRSYEASLTPGAGPAATGR